MFCLSEANNDQSSTGSNDCLLRYFRLQLSFLVEIDYLKTRIKNRLLKLLVMNVFGTDVKLTQLKIHGDRKSH